MAAGLIVVMALACAPAAYASPTMESTFEDDDLLLHNTPAAVDAAMADLQALGVDRVRLPALWRDLADPTTPRRPIRPSASTKLDHAIASAQAHGLAVLLNTRGGAPDWALPAKRPRRAPRGRRLEAVAEGVPRLHGASSAAATRPSTAWSLWNEPNWHSLLQPQSAGRQAVRARASTGGCPRRQRRRCAPPATAAT